MTHRTTSWNAPYTFSGKEKDTETGYHYFGARYYDSDLSIWLSVDPMSDKYPSMSPYNYCANNPVILVDPDGREIWIFFEIFDSNGNCSESKVQYKNGKLYNENGEEYTGNNEYVNQVKNDLNDLKSFDPELECRMEVLEESNNIHTIKQVEFSPNGNENGADSKMNAALNIPTGSITTYDPNNNKTVRNDVRSPLVSLAHELLGHGFELDQGTRNLNEACQGISFSEINAINVENIARSSVNEQKRTKYGGREIPEIYLLNTHK